MRVKYPRTYHLPFSLGTTSDDKMLPNTDHFIGKHVVITEKMDGENTTLYRDGYHARSIDSRHHPSRDWLAKFHSEMCYNIPENMRICGENVYARHSISYDQLPSFFLGFSMWEGDVCLSWNDTLDYFELLGIVPVCTIYTGTYSDAVVKGIVESIDTQEVEGVVVRLADSFNYNEFSKSVAKWVRCNHVQSDSHWMHSAVVPNKLA